MSPTVRRQIRHEADLVEQFTSLYRKRFVSVIEQLNATPRRTADAECLRLCVEVIDMLVESHHQLTQAVAHIGDGDEGAVASAAPCRPAA
jgi:hypothetical protein